MLRLASLRRQFRPTSTARSSIKPWNVYTTYAPMKCNKCSFKRFNSIRKLCTSMKVRSTSWSNLAICKASKCWLHATSGMNASNLLKSRALTSSTPIWWSSLTWCFNRVNLRSWLALWLATVPLLCSSCSRFTRQLHLRYWLPLMRLNCKFYAKCSLNSLRILKSLLEIAKIQFS